MSYKRAIEEVNSRIPILGNTRVTVYNEIDPVSYSLLEAFIAASRNDNVGIDAGGIPDAHGVLVHRPITAEGVYVNTFSYDVEDAIADMLTSADWWILPASLEELEDVPSMYSGLKRTDVVLPVGCGKSITQLVVVYVRSAPDNGGLQFSSYDTAKVGWYNSYVRPSRSYPDVCGDCRRLRKFAALENKLPAQHSS